jgi:hypothetical protein
MPWIYSEDGALKTKLSGLTVSDVNDGALPVKVRFRTPENELGRITYPLIVIDHTATSVGHNREHRGFIQVPYAPEGYANWVQPTDTSIDPSVSPYYGEEPIPMNIDYQITLYTRKAMHGVTLVPTLSTMAYLPPRFGYLQVLDDGTIRTLEVLGGPEPSDALDADGKRTFMWTYAVRVYSEIFLSALTTLLATENVQVRLSEYESLPV